MVNVTSFFTEGGVSKTGLTPQITIRDVDVPGPGGIIINAANMTELGGGWYKYSFVGYDKTKDYAIFVDGGATLPVSERYKEGTNVIDDKISDKALQVTADDILDLLENRMVINRATSELWLYDDTGTNIIKKWPLTDKDGHPVILKGTEPANRGKVTVI